MALTDSLVAYWRLDGDGVDATLRGNDITPVGVSWVAGLIGQAADLESTESDYLWRADNADLSMGDIDFTIAAWVKLESLVNGAIVAKYTTLGNQREYLVLFNATDHVPNNRFSFTVSPLGTITGLTTIDATAFGLPGTGTWYLVVAQHDATANTIGICVNAGATDTAGYATGVFNGTANFNIGRIEVTTTFYPFDGLIDAVGIWKRVLSAAEIAQLYNAGAGLDYPFTTGSMLLLAGIRDRKRGGKTGGKQ